MEYMVLIRADIRCDVWTVDEDGGVGVVPRRRRHSPRKMAVFNEARLVVKRTLRRRRGRGRGRRRGALIPDASAALFAILLLFDLSPRVIMRFFIVIIGRKCDFIQRTRWCSYHFRQFLCLALMELTDRQTFAHPPSRKNLIWLLFLRHVITQNY